MWNTVILSPPAGEESIFSFCFESERILRFASARALRRMTKELVPQTVQPCRKRRKVRYVSHLRCSNFLWPAYPALPGWANLWRASGALAFARPIRDLRIG